MYIKSLQTGLFNIHSCFSVCLIYSMHNLLVIPIPPSHISYHHQGHFSAHELSSVRFYTSVFDKRCFGGIAVFLFSLWFKTHKTKKWIVKNSNEEYVLYWLSLLNIVCQTLFWLSFYVLAWETQNMCFSVPVFCVTAYGDLIPLYKSPYLLQCLTMVVLWGRFMSFGLYSNGW